MKRHWLIEKRKNMNYSQFELAEILGVSQAYISDIENGKKLPGGRLGKRISIQLNFDMNLFFNEVA